MPSTKQLSKAVYQYWMYAKCCCFLFRRLVEALAYHNRYLYVTIVVLVSYFSSLQCSAHRLLQVSILTSHVGLGSQSLWINRDLVISAVGSDLFVLDISRSVSDSYCERSVDHSANETPEYDSSLLHVPFSPQNSSSCLVSSWGSCPRLFLSLDTR